MTMSDITRCPLSLFLLVSEPRFVGDGVSHSLVYGSFFFLVSSRFGP